MPLYTDIPKLKDKKKTGRPKAQPKDITVYLTKGSRYNFKGKVYLAGTPYPFKDTAFKAMPKAFKKNFEVR